MNQIKLVFALCAILGLSACNQEAAAPATQTAAAPADNDKVAWTKYVTAAITPHYKKGVTQRVWNYLILPDEDATRKLEVLQQSVENGLQPGQLFVYAGPDSTKVADLIVQGFATAKPDTLSKSELLFIGKKADEARVRAAVEPTGMTFLFHPVD